MSQFTFKVKTALTKNNNARLLQPPVFRPVAAVTPNPIKPRAKPDIEPPASQFNLEEDDLWNEDELLSEVSKHSPSSSAEVSKHSTSSWAEVSKYSPSSWAEVGKHSPSSFQLSSSHASPIKTETPSCFSLFDDDDEGGGEGNDQKGDGKESAQKAVVTKSLLGGESEDDSEEVIEDDVDLESQLMDTGFRPVSSPVGQEEPQLWPPSPPSDPTDPAPMCQKPPSTPPKPVFPIFKTPLPKASLPVYDSPSTMQLAVTQKESGFKPLGINEETDTWLENINQNEAFVNITDTTPKYKLESNLEFLNKSYVEILEKVMTSFENIPLDTLKMFPDFDADVFMTLRTTRRRVKAKMIQTEKLLQRQKLSNSLPNSTELRSNTLNASNTSYETTPYNDSPIRNAESNSGPGFDWKCSTSLNMPPPSSVKGNNSFVDYTDVLYKTPTKKSTNVGSPSRKATMRNDGITDEFNGDHFPHSQDLLRKFKEKFGLRSFRTNQRQVMNAALLNHDCFVLMPTGGGKSLCYQLPAIVSKGVTVVVSPLRSLILDQVTKLLTLDIPAAHLSGDVSESDARNVYSNLNRAEPDLKLLYVTPEKLTASTALRSCLAGLYRRGQLARFVIDEVHCVSQWGHDFRPDYKKLKELRTLFPDVRMMALTATATPRVRTDILHQLQISNPKWFLSSFNRSNLVYSVTEKKGKTTVKEIASLILSKYRRDTGVVYCFSRKECEDVAQDLTLHGVSAVPYHAGLSDSERARTQSMWMNDRAKVVCATIAFGMGIDKLDVRFVIHYSLPKSIEGYYQESGRAGRDGEKAVCILYYSNRDKVRMLKLIHMDQSPGYQAARKVHVDNLFRVVAFAENKTDCRRALQLEYFGEKFDRALCLADRSTACDNCLHQGEYESVDVTADSKAIVGAVRQVCGDDRARGANYTMLHFVDVFKGSSIKKILNDGHDKLPMYGLGKSWTRLDIERLFRKLIMEEFLKERLMVKDEGITLAYMKPGRRAEELARGSVKISFDVKKTRARSEGSTASSAKQTADPALKSIQDECYLKLREVVAGIAGALMVNPDSIMNPQALRAMSYSLPQTAEDMLAINHVTAANFEKYGAGLLDITKEFAEKRGSLLAPKVASLSAPSLDFENDDGWLQAGMDNDSPYFDTEIEFFGRGGRGRKRGRSTRGKRWPKSKRGRSSSRGSSSSRGGSSSTRGGSSTSSSSAPKKTGSSVADRYNGLMEVPTNKLRFPRPKAFLKNL